MEQLPDDKDTEQAPPSHRGDFGVTASKELAALEGMAVEAKQEAEANPGNPESARGALLAEKRLERFLNEHDNAGAFKFKRFGREMMGMFEDSPDKPRVIEADKETGKLTLAEGQKDRRLMFVNMGELDRINKEGGSHAAGDAALKETVRAIEQAVLAKLGGNADAASSYSMLRYRGNEFMVSFDSISKDDFEDVMRAVREAQPKVEGVEEGAPLVADGFDMQEALDIVNQLQLELGEDERLDPSDPAAATREIIEVMRKRADWSLDVDKFLSRVERVQGKVREQGEEGARAFYDNYIKKMFQGTELSEMEKFADLPRDEAERMAFDYAGKSLASVTDAEGARRAIIDARLKEIRSQRNESVPTPEAAHVDAPTGAKIAEIPELTRGQKLLVEMGAKAKAAETSGNPEDAEIAQLDFQIETARRDKGTGLLERGVHYENLEKSFKEGKDTSMVFVDMGFLRYFDNKGGAEVGNEALKMAAELMERAIDDSGVEGKAFRYGGDEFTVQIDGGPQKVAEFQKALAKLREEAGAIPTGKRGTADGYFPTEMVFNYGTADTAAANDVFESLKEAGKYSDAELSDPDRVANIKAEIMTTIADKAIEEEKAVNRFLMLVDGLRDPKYDADPARKTQVEMLISFSNKAIFAEAGGGQFLRSLAESGKDEGVLRKEIEGWVAERIKDAQEKEGRKADLLSELVEVHGKIRFYERALADSRHETDEARTRNVKLTAELAKAREERDKLVDVRRTLSGE